MYWGSVIVVTPCMGVWIETANTARQYETSLSHPVWVCGLKLEECCHHNQGAASHTLYGCVDWNFDGEEASGITDVTPCMGVWIETLHRWCIEVALSVTPCMGVWIETKSMRAPLRLEMSHPVWVCGLKHHLRIVDRLFPIVTPCMGVWIETKI